MAGKRLLTGAAFRSFLAITLTYITVLNITVLNIATVAFLRAEEPVRDSAPVNELANKPARLLPFAALRQESMAQSLQRLADVNLFFPPGSPTDPGGHIKGPLLPLTAHDYAPTLSSLRRNNRFLKLTHDVSTSDSKAVLSLLKQELESTRATYQPLYAAELAHVQTHFRKQNLKDKTTIISPVYAIHNVPDGENSLVGQKLKILALLWILGQYPDRDSKAIVQQFAEIAQAQRETIFQDDELHDIAKQTLLKMPSLYHPPILITTLLQHSSAGPEKQKLIEQYQLQTRALTLTPPYDLPETSPASPAATVFTIYETNKNDEAFDAALLLLTKPSAKVHPGGAD